MSDSISVTRAQLEEVISHLNECTDAYLFIFDLHADTYYISPYALKTFDLPAAKFGNASETILRIVYPDDRAVLATDLEQIRLGSKDVHSLEYRWVNKNGKPIWISCRGKMLWAENDELLVGRVSIIDDLDKLDLLTGLPTESQMRTDFNVEWAKQQKVSGFLLKIDIDNLGNINEQYGMRTGDKVIALVAECCRKASEGTASAYKLHGDEILCMNLTGKNATDAKKLYQRLKRYIADAEQEIEYEVVFTVSAGAVAFFNDPSKPDDLIKKLNYSLVEAKRKDKNNLTMYNAVDYTRHLRAIGLQERLRESIKDNFRGFELYFQPVVNAKHLYLDKEETVYNVIGAEALLRWSCPELGRLAPDEFGPLLEKSGLIIPVGRWILLTAFNQCREWNLLQKHFRMSVNLSYIQVKKSDVLTDVQIALTKSGVNPRNITLELTESGYMNSDHELQELLDAFQAMNLNIDIDDFGTGYSNLRYLQYLHANTLKLDYTFVHKATSGDEGDTKVIKHITQMAHELNMTVCMEGVEQKTDVEKLQQFAPDKFQGFLFGRPMSAAQFKEHCLRPDDRYM
ncbi:MAG: GGDEF and EAL domain-containing protein [Treponemataceae bacterium]|nr:GGDEF and EAL domain-containing protein [Treponemataceae bacterium]